MFPGLTMHVSGPSSTPAQNKCCVLCSPCPNQILNEDGFVGDIRTQSGDIQEDLNEYDAPR